MTYETEMKRKADDIARAIATHVETWLLSRFVREFTIEFYQHVDRRGFQVVLGTVGIGVVERYVNAQNLITTPELQELVSQSLVAALKQHYWQIEPTEASVAAEPQPDRLRDRLARLVGFEPRQKEPLPVAYVTGYRCTLMTSQQQVGEAGVTNIIQMPPKFPR